MLNYIPNSKRNLLKTHTRNSNHLHLYNYNYEIVSGQEVEQLYYACSCYDEGGQ